MVARPRTSGGCSGRPPSGPPRRGARMAITTCWSSPPNSTGPAAWSETPDPPPNQAQPNQDQQSQGQPSQGQPSQGQQDKADGVGPPCSRPSLPSPCGPSPV